MVKVSFNSALAQKDAAKEEEEEEEGGQNEKHSYSNQVLILSPDTKVRSPARRRMWSSWGEKYGIETRRDWGVEGGCRSYIGPTEGPEVALSRLGLWRRIYFS